MSAIIARKDTHTNIPQPLNGPSILRRLPEELLENICGHIASASARPNASGMFAFRLTCREIHEKTDRIFRKLAFRRVTYYSCLSSAQRLLAISRVPKFAAEVGTQVIRDSLEYTGSPWNGLRERLQNRATIRAQRRTWEVSERDRHESFFHETSRLDAILLSHALIPLHNLQEVEISPVYGTRETAWAEHGPITSCMFSTVLAWLAVCGIKPRSLRVINGMGRATGIDLRALVVPETVARSLEQLRVLELFLSMSAGHDECKSPSDGPQLSNVVQADANPLPFAADSDEWPANLVLFLQCTPNLEALTLRWDEGDSFGSQEIIHAVAHQAHLEHLLFFQLEGFDCDGADLALVLQKHQSLRRLVLRNLEIISFNMSYVEVLRKVANELHLDEFCSWQIAQDRYRTQAKTLGRVVALENVFDVAGADEEFLREYIFVSRPRRYEVWIEPGEDVPRRLAELADDVEVTGLQSLPRTQKERQLREWEEAY